MRPRLEAVWFRSTSHQYQRLARVLEHTARRHCRDWEIAVRQVDPPTERASTGSGADAANHRKLAEWAAAATRAPEGARLLLVDADTFVAGPLDDLWDRDFDLAYTVRTASRFPLNGGVVALRVGQGTRAFLAGWLEQDRLFLRDSAARRPWRARYGGQNQAALGAVLEGGLAGSLGLRVAELPCRVWNCEDTSWARFGPETRIVHVKSALRMTAFGLASFPAVRPLARMWRELEAEASEAAA